MFERRSRIIRDGESLSFDYIPEKVVLREAQMGELERMFSPLAMDNRACSAYLWGSVGSGKTVTAKRFCEDMKVYFSENNRRMDYVYVNCRIRNTEYAAVLDIMRYFDRGFPDRGFAIDEILTLIKRSMEKDGTPLVVILDEVDCILKGATKNLVYQLSRFSEDMKGTATLSLIMISQYSLASLIDEASMSTFRRANMITFLKYSMEDLRAIVRYRADIALEPGVLDDDGVDLIARLSEEFGDARFALEILERAAHSAEKEGTPTVTLDSIRTGGASIYSDVSESKLKDLDMNRKLTLLSISRAIKTAPSISISKCEKTYAVVCEEYNVPAKQHTQFYTYVKDLEKQNLVRTEVKREPDGGRATYIAIDSIPPKELARKIEYLLDTPERGGADLE